MNQQKTITLPVVRFIAGQQPEIVEVNFTSEPETGVMEPEFASLRTVLGDVHMIEYVRLDDGLAIWCDEEGRLVNEPKASCIVNAPYRQGDICGTCVLAVDDLPHTTVDADAGTLEIIRETVKAVLSNSIRRFLKQPAEGYVPAEPSFKFIDLSEGN